MCITLKWGNKVNVQDGAIIHCTYQKKPHQTSATTSPLGIMPLCTVCKIYDDVLIGMGRHRNGQVRGAFQFHNSRRGQWWLEDTLVEANSIYAGVPAKKGKRDVARHGSWRN